MTNPRKKLTRDSDFVKWGAGLLPDDKPLAFDLYLKLGPNHFCKRFSAGDRPTKSERRKYLEGENEFYLRKADAAAWLKVEGKAIDAQLEKATVDPQAARAAISGVLEIVQDVVVRLGFSEELQDLAKKSAALMLRTMGAHPKLSDALKRIKSGQNRYIASHSLMLAEIACALACRVGHDSGEAFSKLCLAAFLHDLPCEDDCLAQCKTIEEAQRRFEDSRLLRLYRMHPEKAASQVKKIKDLPKEVDVILVQHHERPDGSGFPKGLSSSQISSISSVFIVAHALLDYFLEDRKNANIYRFAENHKPVYSKGTFKKILKTLEEEMPLRR